MKHPATPEQIEALQRGEEIELLVRIEPQPLWKESPVKSNQDQNVWCGRYVCAEGSYPESYPVVEVDTHRCPVAVGDTVEVVCSECDSTGWINTSVRWQESGRSPCTCGRYGGEPDFASVIVIANREINGVHHWVLRCSQ